MPGITGGPVNQADHRWLAQDDLRDGVIQNIAFYLQNSGQPGLGGGTRASTVAASAAINTTETLLVRTPLLIPSSVVGQSLGGTLQVGSVVRAILFGTCTTTVANTSTITIRAGTLGTTADASVAAITVPAAGTTGTNVPFEIMVQFTVQTLGAAGTAFGSLVYTANAATGLSATNPAVVAFTSATLATTTATWLDVTFVSAATTTTATFQNCTIEVIP